GEQAFGRILSVPLLRGARGGFMVPMHAKKRMNAIFEPWLVWSPAFRRLEGLDRLKPGLQAVGSFMVPMHAKKRMEAFHKPEGAAGILPADQSEKSTAGRMPAAPWRRGEFI